MRLHRLVRALLLTPLSSVIVAWDRSPAPESVVVLADSDCAGILPTAFGKLP